AAKVGRRRTSGWILERGAALGKEETREEPCARRSKQVHHAVAVYALELLEEVGPHPHAAHRRLTLQRHHQLLRPGVDPQRPLAYVGLLQPEHRGEHEPRLRYLPPAWGVGLQRPAVARRAHRNDPGSHLQRDPIPSEAERPTHVRGAEGTMV